MRLTGCRSTRLSEGPRIFSSTRHLVWWKRLRIVNGPVEKLPLRLFFVVAALERANPGTELLAILPDVLRSGSFTEHWRRRVRSWLRFNL